MKILFLTPYPFDTAPSQRFRFEQYLESLRYHQYELELKSFFSSQNWKRFRQTENVIVRLVLITISLINRLFWAIRSFQFDFVFIHRELAPVGPPILEWIIAKILRKKIIYDFDDAIWLTDNTAESKFEKILRWRSKVALICKWSYKISCGNEYLAAYARKFNSGVIINPTTIDLKKIDSITRGQFTINKLISITIGWTGSHSTLKYLEELESVLKRIESVYSEVSFIFIADQKPKLNLSRTTFISWRKDSEIEDLLKVTIGIMPLPDDEWTRGKCGFKALQFMALGIPVIVAPVGVNKKIINHNGNGLLCSTEEEWLIAFKQLIEDPKKREDLGISGRRTVERDYCVTSNESNFFSLFN